MALAPSGVAAPRWIVTNDDGLLSLVFRVKLRPEGDAMAYTVCLRAERAVPARPLEMAGLGGANGVTPTPSSGELKLG